MSIVPPPPRDDTPYGGDDRDAMWGPGAAAAQRGQSAPDASRRDDPVPAAPRLDEPFLAASRRDDTFRAASRRDDTPVGTIRPIPLGDIAGVDDLVDFRPRRRILRTPRRPRPSGGPGSAGSAGRQPRPARQPVVKRRRRGRVVVRLVLLAFVAAVAYFGITFFQVWSTGRSDQARAVDAIVVMGAAQYDGTPSPQLAARLDHAAALYEQGLAPIVVVTGGKQSGDRFTEAEASAAYLADRGVPDGAILRENSGHTTYESLDGVADLLAARGLGRVLIVTDPFHSLRSRLVAQDVGLTAYVSPTPSSVVTGGTELRHEIEEAAGIAVGRLIGLDRI